MSTKMRAKMQVTSVERGMGWERLKLGCVYSVNNREDNTYSEATPSGSCELMITNKALHGAFTPGDDFYVDFTPIEKVQKT